MEKRLTDEELVEKLKEFNADDLLRALEQEAIKSHTANDYIKKQEHWTNISLINSEIKSRMIEK